MLIARADGVLLIGLDEMNIAMLTQTDSPIHIPADHGALTGQPTVTEIYIDAAPTLTLLVDKWKKAGLLPPDMPFAEPLPTKPRH